MLAVTCALDGARQGLVVGGIDRAQVEPEATVAQRSDHRRQAVAPRAQAPGDPLVGRKGEGRAGNRNLGGPHAADEILVPRTRYDQRRELSQIELCRIVRCLAGNGLARIRPARQGETELCADPEDFAAYVDGADLHAQTAKALCGDADRRQLGKCANFGLLYGSGAAGLQAFAKNSYGLEMTLAEATQHRTRFLRTYAGLRQWQQQIDQAARLSQKVQTRAGLVRVLEPYRMTEALNTPVQGSAAEVLLAALGRLPQWLRGLDARLVLHCHDELLLDSAAADAPAAATALAGCMTEAWERLFPGAVMPGICEARIGDTWATAKKG